MLRNRWCTFTEIINKINLADYLYYINNKYFFENAFKISKDNSPLPDRFNIQKLPPLWVQKYETSDMLFGDRTNNFRVLYWNIWQHSKFSGIYMANKSDPTALMETFEALVKFSLAGKTSSHSCSPKTMLSRMKKYGILPTNLVSFNTALNYIFRNRAYLLDYHSDAELKTNPYH